MVICVGEILADMIGRASGGVTYYERRAGGAPFNVACGIAHFKGQAGFVGRVGDDAIGRWLAVYAAARGLAGLDIAVDRARNTTLAFVELDEAGERTFSFYRKDTADAFIDADPADIAVRADIVHVGSLLLSSDRGRAYADSLFDAAARAGKKVSFDMNYRAGLFPDPSVFRPYLGRADIVKLSSDEAALFGEPVAVARRLHCQEPRFCRKKSASLRKINVSIVRVCRLCPDTDCERRVRYSLGKLGEMCAGVISRIRRDCIPEAQVIATAAGEVHLQPVVGYIRKQL